MKITYVIILFMTTALLTGCETKNEQETSTSETPDIQEEASALYYEFTTFTKTYGDCKTDTSAYCTRINLSYPTFQSDKFSEQTSRINEQIKAAILQQVFPDTVENKNIETFADRFISDYKEIKEAFGEAFGWYANLDSKVLRNDTVVISVELAADMYTGGAHGNFNLQYLNFDPRTGQKIRIESLFESGFEDDLNKIVENKFRQKYNMQPDQDLSDEGYQFENGKYYTDNFALLPKGIKFYYNSYEIAPYSKGPSEVTVKYEDLKSILKMKQIVM